MKYLLFIILVISSFCSCKKGVANKDYPEFLGKWEFAAIGGGFGQYLSHDSDGDYIFLHENGRFDHFINKTGNTFRGNYSISERPACDKKTISSCIKTTEPDKRLYYIYLNEKGQLVLFPTECIDSGATIFNKK